MQLETTRFGSIEVAEDAVLTFTQPIIGYPEQRRYVLIPGPTDSLVTWLQSTGQADLAFLLMNPRDVMPDYAVSLNGHEKAELGVAREAELEIYTMLVVPEDPAEVRTNLRAPILVNPKQRLAKQTVLDRTDYPIRFYLAEAKPGTQTPEEVGHARSDA